MASKAYTGSAYLPSVDDEVSVTALIDEEQHNHAYDWEKSDGSERGSQVTNEFSHRDYP